MLIALHKPYGILSQFTPDGSPNGTLASLRLPPRVYPLGRLDADSEGLLLLSDEPGLNHRLLDPSSAHPRVYWAQVEGLVTEEALARLRQGVDLGDFTTRPAEAQRIDEPPGLWSRDPPIRYRARIPTSWVELTLREGRNRQVRRMTARVGFPTLRLVRARIGRIGLEGLAPGSWREVTTPP